MAHIDRVMADPALPFSVAAVMGPPGHGVRSVLTRGIAPRLAADPAYRAAQLHGEWDPRAAIQFCAAEADIPDRLPSPGAPVRLLIIASTELGALPAWVSFDGAPEVRNFPVGTLSLIEAQGFLEEQLGGPVEPLTMQTLAALTGFVPGMLTPLVDECRDSGCLELIDGVWRLLGDPVQVAVLPYLRAQLAAAGPEEAAALCRIALAEPVALDRLRGTEAALAARLLRDGELRRREDGRLEFCAPALAQGLRTLGPADEQERVHRAALSSDRPTLAAIRWAVQNEEPVAVTLLEKLSAEALRRHDWTTAAAVAELAELTEPIEAFGPAESTESAARAAAAARCRIHLAAAFAARFLPDVELMRAQLSLVEERLPELSTEEAAKTRTRMRIIRAELLHYHGGDLDAALRVLAESENGPEQVAHRALHLVYGGRGGEARQLIREERRTLRRSPPRLRARVAVAETLALVAAGTPRRALRKTTALAARNALTVERAPWLDEEIRAAYVVAALSSDGPAAYPALEKHLADTRDGLYRPDLVTFYLARASWEFLRGDVAASHRLGELALGTAELFDPSGVSAALVALVAETAALTGRRHRAEELCARAPGTSMRSAAVLAGGVHAHLAAARLLLGHAHTGSGLLRAAEGFGDDGQFGFAAEALYAGVRFGRRRAARALLAVAGELDGRLHEMRIAHAEALLAEDPVALIAASDRLREAGAGLYAAETAAAASRIENAPASVRRRASARVASFLEVQPLPGHALLYRVAGPVAGGALTPREQEIAGLIAEGLTNAEIAGRLGLSPRTVEGHISRLYRKTGAQRRAPRRTP